MFWKGIRRSAVIVTATLLLSTLSACSSYPFKYEPYAHAQAYASWSEMESTVNRLESYAENCRPELITVGSCESFADEYQHALSRADETQFRFAPTHIRRLENLLSLYQDAE